MLLLVCAAGLLAGAPLAAARIGSSSTPLSARVLPIGGPCDISTHCWAADARDFDGQNGAHIVYICPSYGSAYAGIFGVWGTDVYSDNSSVCTAAVHAGKIALTSGGIVTIEIRSSKGPACTPSPSGNARARKASSSSPCARHSRLASSHR